MALPKLSILKKLFRAFKAGATTENACKSAGLTVVTFWRWSNDKPWIKQYVEKLKMSRVELVVDAMFQAAIKGDVNAQKNFLLNKNGGWRMGDPRIERISSPAPVVAAVAQTAVHVHIEQKSADILSNDQTIRFNRNIELLKKYGRIETIGPSGPTPDGRVSEPIGENQQADIPAVRIEGQ